MHDPNTQVISMMRRYLSDKFLADITHSVVGAYQDAHSSSAAAVHSKLVKRDRSQRRVSILDTRLEDVARRHFNVQGTVKDNSSRSNTFSELVVEEKVILTSSSVRSPGILPRPSIPRTQNASHNPTCRQLELINSNLVEADFVNKTIAGQEQRERDMLFTLIVHGPTNIAEPDIYKKDVPDADYKLIIGTIDLIAKYGNIQPSTEEDVEVQEIPKPLARLRVRQNPDIEDEDGESTDETS